MTREDNILSDAEHLYAEDLCGKEAVLTVKAIDLEMPKGGATGRATGKKYTFSFAETPKKWIPGVKVRRAIVAAVGSPDRHRIVGAKLRLYPTTCDAFGEHNVPCIRFAGLATGAPTRPLPPSPRDAAPQHTPASAPTDQEGKLL